jgi:S1-C subfamily serine protease
MINLIDVLIVAGVVLAVFRGKDIGFVRQFCSTAGFFVGLFLGALLQSHTVTLGHSEVSKAMITITTTLGSALVFMGLGEYLGVRLKLSIRFGKLTQLNRADNALGSVLAAFTLLLVIWLSANIFASVPSSGLQKAINRSKIVAALTDHLPAAPGVIAGLGKLIDPNGFPQVFTGREPVPQTTDVAPSLAGFDAAIDQTKASVVKIEGQGCGGIVEGSGFVVGDGLVATNAHVVAGINRPYISDENGTHRAYAVWFDPDLDFAVLRTTGLAGNPLAFDTTKHDTGTRAAVLGYPGGGPFDVESAVILDQFIATGRNIYGQGETEREVYEVNAHIIPGNSGGPLITKDGKVIGVVFAESTTYDHVGYTLTAKRALAEINQAEQRNSAVSTASCAE